MEFIVNYNGISDHTQNPGALISADAEYRSAGSIFGMKNNIDIDIKREIMSGTRHNMPA